MIRCCKLKLVFVKVIYDVLYTRLATWSKSLNMSRWAPESSSRSCHICCAHAWLPNAFQPTSRYTLLLLSVEDFTCGENCTLGHYNMFCFNSNHFFFLLKSLLYHFCIGCLWWAVWSEYQQQTAVSHAAVCPSHLHGVRRVSFCSGFSLLSF